MRITASQNNTQVTVSGGNIGINNALSPTATTTFTLNAGETNLYNTNAVNYISATAPIQVGQYNIGTACTPSPPGGTDPYYIMLSPLSQNLKSITFSNFTGGNLAGYFLNLVVPTSCVSSVDTNGVTLPATNFTAVPGNPDYSTAQISLSLTPQTYTVSAPCGINAMVYAGGSADGYGYSAGSNATPIKLDMNLDSITCVGAPVDFAVSGDTTDFIYKEWFFGDDSTSVLAATATHAFSAAGTFPVQFIYEKALFCARDTVLGSITITAAPLPLAAINPVQEYCLVNIATVSPLNYVAGSGTFEYQWQISADSSTWTDITGATNNTYTPSTTILQTVGTYYYRRIRTDESLPCSTVADDVFTLIVKNCYVPVNPHLMNRVQ
jgi:hypothetical protein